MRRHIRPIKARLFLLSKNIAFRLRHGNAKFCAGFDSSSGYNCPWSQYSTPIKSRPEFGAYNNGRLHNMRLAVSRLDNLIIRPAEVFQFWRLIPHPGDANHFMIGPSIIDGGLTYEYGGGLCQISSTLFNVFLEANFEILARSNHSIDAHGEDRFIPLGRDAAVAFGYKDLIVRNQNPVPLRLNIILNTNDMTVQAGISAQSPRPFETRVENEILQHSGDTPVNSGYKIRTRRFVKQTADHWQQNYESIDIYLPRHEQHIR
jgi:vancomycin resistance protein VanW